MVGRLSKIIPVIMSGGSGTRLWPISTDKAPKQFHSLATEATMIQETVLRLNNTNFLDPVIICGLSHIDLVQKQLKAISRPAQKIVLEPMGRNTAPVAAIASLIAQEIDKDALVLLLPADHIIAKPQSFMEAIDKAIIAAQTRIVTFGIKATKPETGYGYIEQGEALDNAIFTIKRFCEKPDLETAKAYVAGGKHDWNAGVFLFNPEVMLSELGVFNPDVVKCAQAALEVSTREREIIGLNAQEFARSPAISIDYAVMEKTEKSAVVPCDIGWADVGSFSEIWRLGKKDENGNHIRAQAIMIDAKDCLVLGNGTPISVIGIDDIVVIASSEGILIAPKNRTQDVKLACEAAKNLTHKS